MGVHDYSCFCCSNEGDQNLCQHTECSYEYYHGDMKPNGEEEDELRDDTDKIYPEEVTEGHQNSSVGSATGHLLVFELPYNGDDTDQVVQLIKDKKYTWFTHVEDEYHWDGWHFDEHEYADEDHWSGNQQGAFNYSIWKTTEKSMNRELKDGSTYWVVTICPLCYNLLFKNARIPFPNTPYICSKYIRDVCNKFDISLVGVDSKDTALSSIKHSINFLLIRE